MHQHILTELAEVGAPSAEWYRERAEVDGHPWPDPPSFVAAAGALLAARALRAAREAEAERHAADTIRGRLEAAPPCQLCGGPMVCANLTATLPYRQCGYAAMPGVGWVHQ